MTDRFETDPEFTNTTPKPGAGRGFTIGKLLLVVAIVAVLIALLLPLRRSAGPAARRAQCTNNLKQIGLALYNYEREHGALPPAYTVDADGRPLHSWRTLILPYLEQEALFRTIDLSKPWDDPVNAGALATALPVYRCPGTDGAPNATTYLATTAPDGCLIPGTPRRLAEVTDAREATIVVIEAGAEHAVPWMAPVDAGEGLVLSLGPNARLSHAGGMNACLVDGGVMFLKADTPARVRRALVTISGGDDDAAAGAR